MRSLWLVLASLLVFMALSTPWDGNHNAEAFGYFSLAVLCLPGILKRRRRPAWLARRPKNELRPATPLLPPKASAE